MPSKESQPLCLPPNLTVEKFSTFIERAEAIVGGPENVTIISKASELIDGDYMNQCKAHDMHAVYDRDFFVASAVICPRDVPEVQALVRLANEFSVPLWPYSIGRNTGYGGTAPRVPGSVGLDLGRHMNRVLEVNVEGAYALLEPGVTFMGLHDHLVKTGLREHLWVDVSTQRHENCIISK